MKGNKNKNKNKRKKKGRERNGCCWDCIIENGVSGYYFVMSENRSFQNLNFKPQKKETPVRLTTHKKQKEEDDSPIFNIFLNFPQWVLP